MSSEALFNMRKRNQMGEEWCRQFAKAYHAGDNEYKGQGQTLNQTYSIFLKGKTEGR